MGYRTQQWLLMALLGVVQVQVACSRGNEELNQLEQLQSQAEQGDPDAQYRLAVSLEYGRHGPKNEVDAVAWYKKSAESGSAQAQHKLGQLYEFGQGVRGSQRSAHKWYRKAIDQMYVDVEDDLMCFTEMLLALTVHSTAEEQVDWLRLKADRGDAAAANNLGCYHFKGLGVPTDQSEAVKWFKSAAEQGNARAMFNLGVAYHLGVGVPQSFDLAYVWAIRAAVSGEPLALAHRDAIEAKLTPAQVEVGQKTAIPLDPSTSQRSGSAGEHSGPSTRVTGSGFFISSIGHFVTSLHVVANAERIHVRSVAGTHLALVLRADPTCDLAILLVENGSGGISPLQVRESSDLRVAEFVATLGYPNPSIQGSIAKYSSGEIAALSGPRDDPRFIQISMPVQPGNSGGPVVDASGEVVGVIAGQLDKIATLKLTGSIPENVNYAVKASLLHELMGSVPGLPRGRRLAGHAEQWDPSEVAAFVERASGMVIVER